jgi:non-heme chloroperoxidase
MPAWSHSADRARRYDRRGFSASNRPGAGYDLDTLASDLHVLLSRLDLREVARPCWWRRYWPAGAVIGLTSS